MLMGIAQVALLVKDYDEAIGFYCGKLGFVVVEDTKLEKKRWVRIRAPGHQGSEILLSKAINKDQLAMVGNQAGGRVLFFMHTSDFESDYQRLKALGVHFLEQPRNEAYGKVSVFTDLYGNRLDLIGPPS